VSHCFILISVGFRSRRMPSSVESFRPNTDFFGDFSHIISQKKENW